ncbi:hypothetical protein KKF82_06755 [Patescibacteria group bacterium]|uniref:Lipoprotein n=1 Tax=viral metagenome TaxID=1070528 RepID=A0A6M3MC76_9ZZZZ|nr:hypothetical protein [Patescibacteria group bacterium]
MKMRKITVLIIAVLSISVLSGCVDNKSADKSKDVQTGINSTAEPQSNASGEKIEAGNMSQSQKTRVLNLTGENGNSTGTGAGSAGSDWCMPGSKITVKLPSGEKEFTVTGITTYDGREVCKAELIYENGKTTRYYSKDGKFEAMNSSASGPGNVSSEARTSVNSSG